MSAGGRIEIDGSAGEGGGQILRTALSLSLCTGTGFRITRIRAGRKEPGLRPQHVAAVQAAARIGRALPGRVGVGDTKLVFEPRGVLPGAHRFDIGTAGSTSLVVQTLLPALLGRDEASTVDVVGGTHNRQAPSFEFLARAFVPILRAAGAGVELALERHGFHPRGGGRVSLSVPARAVLRPLERLERGAVQCVRATAVQARLPRHVGERELAVVASALDRHLPGVARELKVTEVSSPGPGNALVIEVECENAIEVFTGFGERGLPAEEVARAALDEMLAWLAAGVPIGAHLADQLLLPLALAGGGAFRTLAPTPHARTNAEVIELFLPVRIGFVEDGAGTAVVRVAESSVLRTPPAEPG